MQERKLDGIQQATIWDLEEAINKGEDERTRTLVHRAVTQYRMGHLTDVRELYEKYFGPIPQQYLENKEV